MAREPSLMHDGQLSVDTIVVRRLIDEQFPRLSAEPVERLNTDATVNAIFRVGSEITARLPLTSADPDHLASQLAVEAEAMRRFVEHVTVRAPAPIAIGRPSENFPLPWTLQTWVPGTVATPGGLAFSSSFADDLAALIGSIRRVDTIGRSFSGAGRGGDLRTHDEWMQTCFARSDQLLEVAPLRALWTRLRELPSDDADVMSHTDLTPANLLVDGGRLVGVLDTGGFQPADPALDLVAAWHLLDVDARARFRATLGCSDEEWMRGQAWALEQAMGLVWYYRTSNPGMAELGRSTLARILEDARGASRG